jgi:pimeloyl-ACP methyl ester carboxylesterase
VSIERVAHSVGYASKDVFCRAFERRFGVSPRVYRSRFSVVAMLLCIITLMPPARVAAQNGGAGHWEGTMQRGRSALSIAVDFPPGPGGGGAGGGLFTAGGLGAMDVPLKNVRVDGSTHWELVGDQSTMVFDGVRTGDSMQGAFQENAASGVFHLRRVSSSVAKPYTTGDVRFTNDGVTLSGTVLTPRTAGKHPAVVFLHGSGAEGRWASRFTADYLARHDIVALIYDKRGVGESSGDWKTSSLEDLGADARAAVHLVAQRSDVDPQRVGVFGHSQGGFIAPYVASGNAEVRWIVDADGNVGPQYEQDLFRVGTSLSHRYAGEDLRNATSLYREFVDIARMDCHMRNCGPTKRSFGPPPGSVILRCQTTRTGCGPGIGASVMTTIASRGDPSMFLSYSCTASTTRSFRRARASPRSRGSYVQNTTPV